MTTPDGVRVTLQNAYVNEANHDPVDEGYPWVLSDATIYINDNISAGGGYIDANGTENPNHPPVEGTACNIFQADSTLAVEGAVIYSNPGNGQIIFEARLDQLRV